MTRKKAEAEGGGMPTEPQHDEVIRVLLAAEVSAFKTLEHGDVFRTDRGDEASRAIIEWMRSKHLLSLGKMPLKKRAGGFLIFDHAFLDGPGRQMLVTHRKPSRLKKAKAA